MSHKMGTWTKNKKHLCTRFVHVWQISIQQKSRKKNLEFLLTSVGIEYAGQSLALCRIDVTFSRVNSHVSICARNTDANNRGWSSNSVANVLWWPRFWVLCCIAAKIRAFSRFGTRPNLTAVKEKRKSLKRDYNTSWSVLCNKHWYKKTFIYMKHLFY